MSNTLFRKYHNAFAIFFQNLFKPITLYTALGIYVFIFILSLINRFIQIDENWFGEQAYWLAKEGVVRLKTMPGILGFDQQMFVYHKLMVWIGAAIVWSLGWSVFYFKFITLFFYLLFFVVFYAFFKQNATSFSSRHWLIAAVMVIFVPIMSAQSFIFRPEIFVMSLGFISYLFLDKYLIFNSKKWLFLAAIFSGITFLVTLNAIIFPIAGAVLLLSYRKYTAFLIFTMVSALVCLLFTVDLWNENNFELMVKQLNNWPTRKFGKNYMSNDMLSFITTKLLNLINENQRFFWSDRVMAFSGMFFLSYIFNFNYLRKTYRSIFIFTTTLILALNLAGSHIAERYLIFYIPFMAITVAIGILRTTGKYYKYLQYAYFLLIIVNVFFIGKQFRFIFHENEKSAEIHHTIMSKLSDKEANVFGPWNLIYNEISNYHIISYQALQYYQDDLPEKMDQLAFTRLLAKKYNVKYVILDKDITQNETSDYNWFAGGVQANNTLMKEIFRDNKYIVLEMKKQE